MSKLKDKLSANMRKVKADQQPAAPTKAQATAKQAAKAAKQPVAKPATPKSVVKPAAARSETVRSAASKVAESGSTLFPARVWPD